MTTPSGPAPAVPPVTQALRAQAAQQRGGYVYAIDPYFDPDGAVPPFGIIGGWSVDSSGRLVSFTHNANYRPSPRALEFPPPATALDEALQRAVTGYGSEQEFLTAFRDATLLLFTEEGQTGLYTIVEDDGSRCIPAFTHPTHAPDSWPRWQQITGRHLAATGLPIRLNPGHRISLTIPGEAGVRADGEGPSPSSSSVTSSGGLPESFGNAPLLAAGLLAALGRRRRTALWQSAMGAEDHRTPELRQPKGAAADTQDALLIGAAPEAVRDLDRALGGLASALAAESRTLPTVYVAWLTDSELTLQLAHPADTPPAPWQLGRNETFWRIQRAHIPMDETGTGPAAPCPGLVSLGSLEGAHLLLNLEAVPGPVSLTGAYADRNAVLTSVAAELATSDRSDRTTVTLVGFGAELTTLDPTRVRHFDDVEAFLESMDAETRQRRDALAVAGHDSVLTARADPSQPSPWAPHLVLLATQPTEAQASKIAALAADSGRLRPTPADSGRLGISYLAATEKDGLPGTTWPLDVTPDGRLLAPSLGLELQAQLLPPAQRDSVVQLFANATPDGLPDPGAPQFMVDITPSGRPAVYVRLIGTYETTGLDTPAAEHSPLLHEALVMLLLHREGVHPRVLAAGLWPGGVTEDVRDTLVERLRTWLGTDPDGAPRLGTDTTGRLTLAPSVVSDLDVLRTLHHEATTGRAARNARIRERTSTRRTRHRRYRPTRLNGSLAHRPQSRPPRRPPQPPAPHRDPPRRTLADLA